MDQPDRELEQSSPQVYQCSTCKTIVGDSSTIVSVEANEALKLIALRSVCNVDPSTELRTSDEAIDRGSAYSELVCIGCQVSR